MASALQSSKLGFIGGGNMASAIIGGLSSQGISKENVIVAEPWDVNREKLEARGIATTESNAEAARAADVVIVAVKPQVARAVCQELRATLARREKLPVVVSIAAGITLASLVKWSTLEDGRTPHIVRVMPNTPALVGEGATGLFAGKDLGAEDKALVDALMKSVSSVTEWVETEQQLDIVTALSGSGPAYFFAMVEHLAASAAALGLPRDQATRLAKQTCFGAGKMLVESSEQPSELRINVTSPNGTTQAALESFAASGFKDIVDKAVKASADRAAQLGETLGLQ